MAGPAAAEALEQVEPPATLEEAVLRAQDEAQLLDLRRNDTGAERGSRALRYLTYPKLIAQVRPVLLRNALAWNTFPTTIEVNGTLHPALRYRLTFTPSGEHMEDVMLLATKENTSQAQGSGITYARRYALQAVLDLSPDGDDDGQAASTVTPRPAPRDPEMALPQPELERMCEAIVEVGLQVEAVLRHVGAGDPVSVGDAKKVKAFLDARAAGAAGS